MAKTGFARPPESHAAKQTTQNVATGQALPEAPEEASRPDDVRGSARETTTGAAERGRFFNGGSLCLLTAEGWKRVLKA
jgi:hypothetical protein